MRGYAPTFLDVEDFDYPEKRHKIEVLKGDVRDETSLN